jgi:hypothetical protein
VSAFVKEYLFGAIRAGDDPEPEIADAIRLAIDDAPDWARRFHAEPASPATVSSWAGALPPPRKSHVSVEPDAILAWLRERGSASLHEIARHFDISTASAQKKADGLAHAGRLDVTPGNPTSARRGPTASRR